MTADPKPQVWPDLPEPYNVDAFLDVIAESAKRDRSALVPGATLQELDIASLDMVDILFELEEKFNVYVPMGDELANVTYLADLVEVLSNLISAGVVEPSAAA
jgi:acyl carrier protein